MAFSDTEHFLACQDCGRLHPLWGNSAAPDDEAVREALEAFNEFLTEHHSHHTTRVSRCGSECCADRPLWDPMASLIFSVTDGERSYVVTATRDSIDEPRTYRFVPGTLTVDTTDVDIDPTDLRRGLDSQFYPYALRPTKLDRFLSVLREVVSQIDLDELAIAFDAADDPTVSIARLPDRAYMQLVIRCAEIFDPWEFSRVTNFLRDNRDEAGLLALRVRRHFTTAPA